MFTTVQALIDESKFPPNAYYAEPRDNSKTYPTNSDTLDTFSTKIANMRAEKGFPQLNPQDLYALIVTSLENTTQSSLRPRYFHGVQVRPSISQVWGLAKTITAQASNNLATATQREDRSRKCLQCPLHKASGAVSPIVLAAINKSMEAVSHESLSNLQQSDLEKRLGTCGMCGCGMQSKIRTSLLATLAALGPNQLDKLLKIVGPKAFGSCWILDEAVSNTNFKQILMQKVQNTGKLAIDYYNQFTKK
jgi:hypothetical protein